MLICYILYEINDNVYIIKVVSQEKIKCYCEQPSYCEKPSLNYVPSLNFAQWNGKRNDLNSGELARDNLIVFRFEYK